MLLPRALDNLLDNAAKYSEDEIALRAQAAPGSLTLEVRDRGTGIAPEDMKRLFTPFFRADHSHARQTGGLGLAWAWACCSSGGSSRRTTARSRSRASRADGFSYAAFTSTCSFSPPRLTRSWSASFTRRAWE